DLTRHLEDAVRGPRASVRITGVYFQSTQRGLSFRSATAASTDIPRSTTAFAGACRGRIQAEQVRFGWRPALGKSLDRCRRHRPAGESLGWTQQSPRLEFDSTSPGRSSSPRLARTVREDKSGSVGTHPVHPTEWRWAGHR